VSREPQPVRYDMAGAFMDPHPEGRYVTYDAYMARDRAHRATLERAEAAWRRENRAASRGQFEAGLNAALRAVEGVLARTAHVIAGEHLTVYRSLPDDLLKAIEGERMR